MGQRNEPSRAPTHTDPDRSRFHVEQTVESLQDRLRQLELELEHTHPLATLGTVVGSIAHEFNNLLTPVISYAELAKLHPEDRELTDKALDRAAGGAEHAAQIARAILDLVRRAKKVSDPPVASVREAIDKALLCLARPPSQDGIELTVEIEEGLRAEIEPVALQQILLNILLNAINAMRGAGGELAVSAGSTWNGVQIRIADTGPGIDPARMDRLFEPFGARDGVGTGLGLSIVRRLAEKVGGSIKGESTPGQGAAFTITLHRPAAAGLRRSA